MESPPVNRQEVRRDSGRDMGKVILGLVLVFVLVVVGGAFFLAFWQPAVPSTPVVKVLPNARFPK